MSIFIYQKIKQFTPCCILLVFILTNCAVKDLRENYINTEIDCPNRFRVLASHALADDIVAAIQRFEKGAVLETAKYTVIKLKDGRSFHIKRMLPHEVLSQCYFREILRSDTNYADYFYYF